MYWTILLFQTMLCAKSGANRFATGCRPGDETNASHPGREVPGGTHPFRQRHAVRTAWLCGPVGCPTLCL